MAYTLPKQLTNIRPAGAGTHLVRLADQPLDVRLKALDDVIHTAKTRSEAELLLSITLAPGDHGGRIAA